MGESHGFNTLEFPVQNIYFNLFMFVTFLVFSKIRKMIICEAQLELQYKFKQRVSLNFKDGLGS